MDSPKASPSLVFGLEDRVPWGAAVVVSFQQVAAMVVGTVTPPLILAGILKFSPTETAYLVSMALLASALGTLLQTTRPGPVGSGLLSVTGTSFSFLQPLIMAGQTGGLPMMFGLSIATAPIQLLVAPFLPRLRRWFTPLVSGVVVLLIGLSLIPSAMMGIVTPAAPGAPAWAGAAVAAVVLATVLGAQIVGHPKARLAGVLLGVIVGYAFCGIMGWLQVPALARDQWIVLPHWLPHQLAFRWELAAPFLFIYFVSVLEAMGDMTATAQLSGLDTTTASHWQRLRGGVLADGLTSLASGCVGAFPSTTYAQNNGVIQITGVASRRVGPIMAAMLAFLGLVPVVGRWFTAMPPAVLGALAVLLFGLVAVSGLRLIASRPIGHREALIVALSLAAGLGIPSQTEWLKTFPLALQAVGQSGIAIGGITALVMSALLKPTVASAPASVPAAESVELSLATKPDEEFGKVE